MEVIAHRGCAGQYPENTVYAVQSCGDHVDRIEVDVRRCGSGDVVAFHADDLSRLTDESGAVHATAMERLRSTNVVGSDWTIPTLDSLIEVVPSGVDLQLDLKHPGLVSDIRDLADDIEGDTYVCSIHIEELNRVAASDWDVPCGYVAFPYFQTRPVSDEEIDHIDFEAAINAAVDHGCEFVEAPVKLCVQTEFVTTAHDAGLDVVVWTVDTSEVADRLSAAGVDGLIVDRHDIL